MSKNEMWESVARPTGDMAGIFEFDGETGYFYLYKASDEEGKKVKGAIHVISGTPDFGQEDICIRWAANDNLVGLFIRSRLWAAFDCRAGVKYGGNYKADGLPPIPSEIARHFE